MKLLEGFRFAVLCGAALALGACGGTDRKTGADEAAIKESPNTPAEALIMQAGAALIGKPGPALSFATLDGKTVDLAQSYGRKPVYLKMWATWCGICRKQMPGLQTTYERIRNDFTVLSVATGINESKSDVAKALDQLGASDVPTAVDDGKLADYLNLRATPVHLVIGRDGKVLYIGQSDDERLDAALAAAAKQPPRVASVESTMPKRSAGLTRLPDLALRTIDGNELGLASNNGGKPTVMVFFLSWCETYDFPKNVPDLAARCGDIRKAAERGNAAGDARWIEIASSLWVADDKDIIHYRDDNGLETPIVFDKSGELFRSFGVRSTPVILVFGADGGLVARIDESKPGTDLHAALDRALSRART